MGVTLFFLEKKSDDPFSFVIASERDDLFSCRLLTTPIFPRRLSSVLSKFSHKKINFSSGVTRGGPLPHPTLKPQIRSKTGVTFSTQGSTERCKKSENSLTARLRIESS